MLTLIFKRLDYIYVTNDDSVEDGWKQLAKRQSMSVENCKKQYTLLYSFHDKYNIKKIKIR